VLALLVGFLGAISMPEALPWHLRGVVAWDLGAATLVGLAWSVIARANQEQTEARAASEDPGRKTVWVLALASSTFSLFAAIFVLRKLRELGPQESICWGALSVLAIVLSWVLTHTTYALRYAHLYYRDEEGGMGGIEFPGGENAQTEKGARPDDRDFAYFAFTIGMCFQVSDATVSDRAIRRAVLGHALISFVYNTMIVALVLNLLFSVLN